MAVVVRYVCTRDGAMFEDRKQANAHDRMLESIERLRELIEASAVAGLDERLAEGLAEHLVRHKDQVLAALRGSSSADGAGEEPAAATADEPAAEEDGSTSRPGGGRRRGKVA
jgi:dsDNA-binding SOS-regulon protein